jgi:hypothetical protein
VTPPVAIPYQDAFIVLLVAFLGYSWWSGRSPRYLLYGALILLAAATVADWLGEAGAADNLALDLILALMGAVGVTAWQARFPRASGSGGTARADPPGPDAAQPGEAAPEHRLDDLEGQRVPVVDTARQQDDADEQHGDPEPQGRQE